MSYYMMGTSGLGQDLSVYRAGQMLESAAQSHGIAVPGVSVYKGLREHHGHHGRRAHHGYGAYPVIESPPIGPKYHRTHPAYVYGAGAGPYVGRRPVSGFGQADASSVCSDWLAGGNGDNAAGTRAAQAIQTALNSAGYGPIAVDGVFGSASIAAWNQFAQANGQTTGWPDCPGITALLSGGGGGGGGNGGGGGGGGSSNAGMLLGLGALALLALGAAALLAKKKKGPAHHHDDNDKLIIEEKRA